MNIQKHKWLCPICKEWDTVDNMLPATLESVPCENCQTGKASKKSTWLGKAHLFCVKEYNKKNKQKYSIQVYDETEKFLGQVTPI